MPKTLLAPMQVMLCLSAITPPYCFGTAFILPHGQQSKIWIYLPLNTQSLRMTSSAADLLKDQHDNRFFRGHGTHLTNNMPKTLLAPMQVMLCLSAITSPYCFGTAFILPHGQQSKIWIYLPLNTQSLRMTSSAADLLKDQHDNRFFRGHGTHLTNNMPKTLLAPMQVMLCLSAITSPYCFGTAFILPHGQQSKTSIYLPLNTQSTAHDVISGGSTKGPARQQILQRARHASDEQHA
ncbi:hypothetical protein MTO96_015821 [Rhipicephalus appendiculatus]